MFVSTSCTATLSHSASSPRNSTLSIKWSPSRCPVHFAVHFWCTRQHFDDTQFHFVVLQWLPILPAATRQSYLLYSSRRGKEKVQIKNSIQIGLANTLLRPVSPPLTAPRPRLRLLHPPRPRRASPSSRPPRLVLQEPTRPVKMPAQPPPPALAR